jgi:hypothetical protein
LHGKPRLCALDLPSQNVRSSSTCLRAHTSSTPISDPDAPMSPSTAASPLSEPADPLVVQLSRELAAIINQFKRELDKRDSTWADARGKLELVLESQTFLLTVVPDEGGEKYPVTVEATLKSHDNADGDAPLPRTTHVNTNQPTRHASHEEPERDLVSPRKRKYDANVDTSNKQRRTDGDEDIMPLINRGDRDDPLSKLREDIQKDTSECVSHVYRLLRRCKHGWHEKSHDEFEQSQAPNTSPHRRNSTPNGKALGALSPSSSLDRDDQNGLIPKIVRRESKLISHQIKWVEDCRRIAASAHDKCEETWRTSSAGFHDRQRQDRENFQNKILHESSLQSQTLNHILNEVKVIGLYAQNVKWEMPNTHLTHPPPSTTAPPPFPTQPPPDL